MIICYFYVKRLLILLLLPVVQALSISCGGKLYNFPDRTDELYNFIPERAPSFEAVAAYVIYLNLTDYVKQSVLFTPQFFLSISLLKERLESYRNRLNSIDISVTEVAKMKLLTSRAINVTEDILYELNSFQIQISTFLEQPSCENIPETNIFREFNTLINTLEGILVTYDALVQNVVSGKEGYEALSDTLYILSPPFNRQSVAELAATVTSEEMLYTHTFPDRNTVINVVKAFELRYYKSIVDSILSEPVVIDGVKLNNGVYDLLFVIEVYSKEEADLFRKELNDIYKMLADGDYSLAIKRSKELRNSMLATYRKYLSDDYRNGTEDNQLYYIAGLLLVIAVMIYLVRRRFKGEKNGTDSTGLNDLNI